MLSAAMFCVTAMPASAQIAGIDAMKEWNLIVLGDLQSSSEVEGRTFVGGNLTGNSSNYQAISNTNVNQNIVQSGLGTSDPAFLIGLNQQKSVLTTSMGTLSTDMKGLDANSQLTISGNRGTFNAQPDNKGVAVFNISSADLDKIGEIQFNLNGADTAIVNVSGTNINLNDNFLGGTNGLGEHVIWNFADATSLKSTTAWGGSVLAPNAAANTGNYIEGSAVFGSLVQNGEFHLGTYTGGYTPPVTPPGGGGGPSPIPGETLGLFALGAAGLIGLRWRRKRKEAAAA
ncbi:MAG: choice-of-anchor A family protein [Sphingomonadales bacterium]|nr:MAG: choice-of-anchor A family protein [Sphingomonadales bacterium]